MTGRTPIPAGVLTVDDERKGSMFALRVGGEVVAWCNGYGRARLLAGPPRPDGVPEHAVAAVGWWVDAEDADGKSALFMPDGSVWDDGAAHLFRTGGQPVPPYQPDPDPEALLVEKITADWAHPDPADSASECEACADGSPCAEHQFITVAPPVAAGATIPSPSPYLREPNRDPKNYPTRPPVAGERTGPLGLNEGDRIRHTASGRFAAFIRYAPRGMMLVESIESGERIIYAPELWEPVRDAQPEPAETHAAIAAECRGWTYDKWYDDPRSFEYYMHQLADRIEAASRPDPDTITVNLDIETVRYYAADTFTADDELRASCRAALAAAGLPQEPTEPEAQR